MRFRRSLNMSFYLRITPSPMEVEPNPSAAAVATVINVTAAASAAGQSIMQQEAADSHSANVPHHALHGVNSNPLSDTRMAVVTLQLILRYCSHSSLQLLARCSHLLADDPILGQPLVLIHYALMRMNGRCEEDWRAGFMLR